MKRFLKTLAVPILIPLAIVKALIYAVLSLMLAPIVGAVYFFCKWGLFGALMSVTYSLLEDFDKILSGTVFR